MQHIYCTPLLLGWLKILKLKTILEAKKWRPPKGQLAKALLEDLDEEFEEEFDDEWSSQNQHTNGSKSRTRSDAPPMPLFGAKARSRGQLLFSTMISGSSLDRRLIQVRWFNQLLPWLWMFFASDRPVSTSGLRNGDLQQGSSEESTFGFQPPGMAQHIVQPRLCHGINVGINVDN